MKCHTSNYCQLSIETKDTCYYPHVTLQKVETHLKPSHVRHAEEGSSCKLFYFFPHAETPAHTVDPARRSQVTHGPAPYLGVKAVPRPGWLTDSRLGQQQLSVPRCRCK